MSVYIAAYEELLPAYFETEVVSKNYPYGFLSGKLALDQSSEFYPSRSDLKIMRSDVVASILVTNKMLKEHSGNLNRNECGLFVASGVFLESSNTSFDHLLNVYKEYEKIEDKSERTKKIYRASPPLLALQTLTNSSMSFIAQYTGIKGNNSTFGTTSFSGILALQQAFQDAAFDQKSSVVCTANCGGIHSFLMNLPHVNYHSSWKENATAASILIQPNRNEKTRCEISHVKTYYGEERECVLQILKEIKSTHDQEKNLIISGAFTEIEAKRISDLFYQKDTIILNAFEIYGNSGASNMLLNVGLAIKLFEEKKIEMAHLIDKDCLGRLSYLRLKKV